MTTVETPEIHDVAGFGMVIVEAFPTGTGGTIYNASAGGFVRAAGRAADAVRMVVRDVLNASLIEAENF